MKQINFEKIETAYNLKCLENEALRDRVTSLEEEVAQLKELLKLQQDRLFGKKSEANLNKNVPEKGTLKALYTRLCGVGKSPKVALTACMRKLIVWANAILATGQPWCENHI